MNRLKCSNCRYRAVPSHAKWKCKKCGDFFKSEVKFFNKFELKPLQNSVKSAIIEGKVAKPKIVGCCEVNINTTEFYHKETCKGILYLGEMNKRTIVVCSQCLAMNYYDDYVWCCPKCNNRFKVSYNQRKESNNNNTNTNNNTNISSHRTTNNTVISQNLQNNGVSNNNGMKVNDNNELPRSNSNQQDTNNTKVDSPKSLKPINSNNVVKNRRRSLFVDENNDLIQFQLQLASQNKPPNDQNSGSSSIKKTQTFTNQIPSSIKTAINKGPIVHPDNNFSEDDIKIEKQIGEGAFAKIYSVTYLKNDVKYALKKTV